MVVTIRLETGILDGMIKDTAGPVIRRYVHDGVHYGIYQEMGVQNGFGKGIVIPAHPFMRPAVEAVEPSYGKAFQNQMIYAQVERVVEATAWKVAHIAAVKAPFDTGDLRNSLTVSEDVP